MNTSTNSLKSTAAGVENRGVLNELGNLVSKVTRSKIGKLFLGAVLVSVAAIGLKKSIDANDQQADNLFSSGNLERNSLTIDNPSPGSDFKILEKQDPEMIPGSGDQENVVSNKDAGNNIPVETASSENKEIINIEKSNILSNGQISLAFYNDHISYSFGEDIKKAINNNENGVASGLIMTDATLNGDLYSGNGSITADGGHLVVPELSSGVFTFLVFTQSGEYKITGTLAGGLPSQAFVNNNSTTAGERLVANNSELPNK